MNKQIFTKKQTLKKPILMRIVAFEALLLCIGIIATGIWFCSALLYELAMSVKCLSTIVGLTMTIGGCVLASHFLPNLMARITVSCETITWRFLFQKICINLKDVRYTDIINYSQSSIVPYIVIATEPMAIVNLDKVKRNSKVVYFQLYHKNIRVLHEAIPPPYNQILNKYLHMYNKRKT